GAEWIACKPGDFGACGSTAAREASGPTVAVSPSNVTPPGLSRTVAGPVRSSTVDSIPTGQRPPSRIMATLRPREPATCSAVVGLILPEGLALGAAIGRPQAVSTARATAWLGTRTAKLSKPALARSETVQSRRRGSTRVNAPGQNLAASRSAR